MTDKLPEWVEKWIEQNEREYYMGREGNRDMYQRAIDVDDLRAFLSQYVLCEKEPVAHVIPSKLARIEKAAVIDAYANATSFGDEPSRPLYAPADMGKEGGNG